MLWNTKKASVKWTLNKEEIIKIAKDSLIFLAPALLVFLTDFQKTGDWRLSLASVKVWGLGIIVNTLKKFTQGK